MREASASTAAFGASVMASAQRNQQAFSTVGLAAVALGGTIAFGMKQAADAAIAFESSFAGVRKTVDATEPEFEAMAAGLREMATEMPVNVNELNRIAEAAGQLGVSKDAILGFTDTVAKLGATTNIVGDEAATSMARIANIMQTPQDEFDRLGATIVALGNAGASTESEIVEMSMRIAGAGQVVGLTEAEVLAFANALSSVGVEAQMGGSAISRVMIAIADNVATGGEKLEAFADVAGMSSDKFREAFQKDAAGAIITFIEGLGRISDAGGNVFAVLEGLGLSEVRVRDALLRAAGAGDLFRESIELGSRAWEENTALNEEAGKRFETTASQIQIATNRINDAAISFGQLLLPAIGAVAGAVGDFADLINGLPGPVKAVALAVGGVGAAMSLLAGGTLLLLPRMAAVKGAMADVGIKAGLMKGSLALAVRAINPWSLAITGVAIGLGYWAQQSAAAKARVEELTSAIEADSGALGENTRALVVNRLQQDGALQMARNLGLDLVGMTDAVLNGGSAWREYTVELVGMRDTWAGMGLDDKAAAMDALLTVLERAGGEVDAATAAAELHAQAMGEEADAAGETGGALEGAGGAVDDFTEETEEALSITDQFTQALEGLAGTALDVEQASLGWLDALAAMREELRDGAKTLDDNTAAGRENRHSILNAVDAAIAHGAAVAEETGSLRKGVKAVNDHIEALINQAVKAGVSEDAVREYIKQLNLTPKQVRTAIQLLGADKAIDDINAIKTGLMSLPAQKRVEIIISREGHTGGLFHAGGAVRRMHAGGLKSDEVPAILQRGEYVINRRAANRIGLSTLSMLNRMHAGGGTGSAGVPGDNWLDQQFTRLEDAMDEAASLIRDAVKDGLDRAHVAIGRELANRIEEKQRKYERLLEEARDHLADIKARMKEFADSIAGGFTDASGLVGGLASLHDELTAEGGPGFTAAAAGTFLAEQLAANQGLAAALQALSDLGLAPTLLAELASQGPEALPFVQALVAGGQGLVDAFNETEAAIAAIAHDTASDLATENFGEAVDKAAERLDHLRERMADVISRLGAKLERFIEDVRVDTVAAKFKDLDAALEDLLGSLVSPRPADSTKNARAATDAAGRAETPPTVYLTVEGWVGNDQDLAKRFREELVRLQRRNGTTGLQ